MGDIFVSFLLALEFSHLALNLVLTINSRLEEINVNPTSSCTWLTIATLSNYKMVALKNEINEILFTT